MIILLKDSSYLNIDKMKKMKRAFNSDVETQNCFFLYKFNIKIHNLRITYDYERSTIQYHETIPRGAKDHDSPRAIHMKNINLKLQLNMQLRETITNNGTEKRDSMIGERYKNEHGVVA